MDRRTLGLLALGGAGLAFCGWLRPVARALPAPATSFAGAGVVASELGGPAVRPPVTASPASHGEGERRAEADATRDEADAQALDAVRAAANDPGAESTAFLLHTLDRPSDHDEPARLEAIDALVARRHGPALGRLLALDPASDPFLGPTILVGIGELGAAAPDAASKRAALDRLATLLVQEKQRNGADSAGNVVTIVEAIGTLGHPDGAAILERELADPFHDTAGKTAIVVALGRVGRAANTGALGRLRTEVASQSDDRYEHALRRELLAAIDDATPALARRP